MSVADILFPKRCIRCARVGAYICKRCIIQVQFAKAICPQCKRPSIDGFVHQSCTRPQGLDGVINLWEYKRVVKATIVALKFQYVSDVADELSDHFVKLITLADKPIPQKALIVPIPLHCKREKWRGFNQSALLGKQIAKKLQWSYVGDILVRKHNTKAQTEVKVKEKRKKNILGAFEFNSKYKEELKRHDKTIFVFDDVWTTGATLREAGKVLKRNGAKVVWGMTVAH